ncbi:MAG: single-stranded-DNA-specific exonuclease RecJ [Clostridia bacterium]|nr:single-stranded-DNA-specific exonuclease RecJ [Clostridia bacterium]
MNNKVWVYKNIDNLIIKELMTRYGFTELCSGVLHNRLEIVGGNPDNLFKRVLHNLHNPFLLNDMDKAVERIEKAIMRNEKITIYGDYDADGVTSTSILYMFLRENGAIVDYFIPNRFSDGYGMNIDAIKNIAESGTKLIITVDNGIAAYNEIEFAKTVGIDVIVTDHHECPEIIPDCCAVINPKRKDSMYPFSELAGVGVTFKLITALNKDGIEKIIKKYILITAIGTIADIVPLNDENRAIVIMGLKMVGYDNNVGVNALLNVSGIEGEGKVSDFAFGIVPRINAAGRLENASICVELFCSKDSIRCSEIAKKLDELNEYRQNIEKNITESVFDIIDQNKLYKDNVIVVFGEGWNSGVIGIVASKVCEKYYKPCIVLTDEDDVVKGSGRSVTGFDLYEALCSCSDILLKYGGHALAAGLSIDKNNIELFKIKINEYADKLLNGKEFVQTINIDYTLNESFLNLNTIKSIAVLEPYGVGNPKPVFALLDAKVTRKSLLSEGKHIKLTLNYNGASIDAIGFNMGEFAAIINEGFVIDVAGNLDINVYRGIENPQMIIRDIKRIKQR